MTLDDIPAELRSQVKIYALQCVVAALCVRLLELEDNSDAAASDLMETALGSIRKFDMRGPIPADQKDALRQMMEAMATETVSAAAHSVRSRGRR